MLLSILLKKIKYDKSFTEREVFGITNNSKEVNEGSVFVCIKGFVTDGHDYAKSAYDNGARVFVAERELSSLPNDATVIVVENTRRALALLSCEIYGNPSHKLRVIGITGTKGKTTTALMIKQLLDSTGIPTGYIGSNGVSYGSIKKVTANTTPESCILQSLLKNMVDAGMQAAVIEVSSQALKQLRTLGIRFDITVFTNLSLDHVGQGEHESFDDYFLSKKKLFDEYESRLVIANSDDEYTPKILADCKKDKRFYSIDAPSDYRGKSISLLRYNDILGMSFECELKNSLLPCKLSIPGEFNIHNALATIAVADALGIDRHTVSSALSQISIEGRFEVISAKDGACFVLDYAHNGLSLRSALTALRKYEPRRLICLFGSVGNRTQIRRVQMGKAAAECADFSILTSDNPNTENPQNIIDDIATQFSDESTYISIPDRRKAIEYAFEIVREGDIVLLAGKGHERYQLINGRNEYFCEREIILECINKIEIAK